MNVPGDLAALRRLVGRVRLRECEICLRLISGRLLQVGVLVDLTLQLDQAACELALCLTIGQDIERRTGRSKAGARHIGLLSADHFVNLPIGLQGLQLCRLLHDLGVLASDVCCLPVRACAVSVALRHDPTSFGAKD